MNSKDASNSNEQSKVHVCVCGGGGGYHAVLLHRLQSPEGRGGLVVLAEDDALGGDEVRLAVLQVVELGHLRLQFHLFGPATLTSCVRTPCETYEAPYETHMRPVSHPMRHIRQTWQGAEIGVGA